MKLKKLTILFYVVLAIFIVNVVADAQIRKRPKRFRDNATKPVTSIGVRFGNDFKHEQLLLGGHLWLPVGIFWKFAPSFEYYFVDENENYSRWQFNADFMFKPRPRYPLYFGGGVAVNYIMPEPGESESKVGGNALVGLDFGRFRLPSMYPYLQARWTFLEDDTYFSLLGGINLILR